MADETTLRRVKREIQVMHICASPHLPKFGPLPLRELRLRTGQTIVYFLEEYIDGLPLNSVHKPMSSQEVIWLGRSIAEALAVLAQNGYIHRDVKPMNIIQRTPTDYVLIDAGIALDRDGEGITVPGDVVGTPLYLSPDQIKFPQKQLDSRSDLFSLGITLYEYATGQHPFLNDETPHGDVIHNILFFKCLPPQYFNPAVPRTLCDIILRLLNKDRDKRFSDPVALLNAFMQGSPQSPLSSEQVPGELRL
jgi:serine/threonine-protein kinase